MRGNIWRFLFLILGSHVMGGLGAQPIDTYTPAAVEVPYIAIESRSEGKVLIQQYGWNTQVVLSGSPDWGGMHNGTITKDNQVRRTYLGMYNTNRYYIYSNDYLDMWVDGIGQPNILQQHSCDLLNGGKCNSSDTDIDAGNPQPQQVDAKGFYGLKMINQSNNNYIAARLSEDFVRFLNAQPMGAATNMTLNACWMAINIAGKKCIDEQNGSEKNISQYLLKQEITLRKKGGVHLEPYNAVYDIRIDSNNNPYLVSQHGEGGGCSEYKYNSSVNGIVCPMMRFNFDGDLGVMPPDGQSPGAGTADKAWTYIQVGVNNKALDALATKSVWISVDQKQWYYSNSYFWLGNFARAKGQTLYFFFTRQFFKDYQSVMGGSDPDGLDNTFYLRFKDYTGTGTDFKLNTHITIKPQDFNVDIVSNDGSNSPVRNGKVADDSPPLVFDYKVTTSGVTKADKVRIKVTGPNQIVNGIPYCVFSNEGQKVLFPAYLQYADAHGVQQQVNTGCDSSKWYDITNTLKYEVLNGSDGVASLSGTQNIKFIIPMNSPISQKMVDGKSWFGSVSANGTIEVQAQWNDASIRRGQ